MERKLNYYLFVEPHFPRIYLHYYKPLRKIVIPLERWSDGERLFDQFIVPTFYVSIFNNLSPKILKCSLLDFVTKCYIASGDFFEKNTEIQIIQLLFS